MNSQQRTATGGLIFILMVFCTIPGLAADDENAQHERFTEKQPEDRISRGGFSLFSTSAPDIEAGEIETRGNFTDSGYLNEERNPNDADSGGDFGNTNWPPR